jgi:hypothetical protein
MAALGAGWLDRRYRMVSAPPRTRERYASGTFSRRFVTKVVPSSSVHRYVADAGAGRACPGGGSPGDDGDAPGGTGGGFGIQTHT